MEYRSENINELATALAKAQGENDRFTECKLIKYVTDILSPKIPRNTKNTPESFFQNIVFGASDCWYFRGFIDALGYGIFRFNNQVKSHRVSWTLFHGEIPDGMKVLHRCDVRNCVNPDHLFLGTQKDNVRDMMSKGRQKFNKARCGEGNHMSKLSEKDVLEMRSLYEEGLFTHKQIAKLYDVTTMTAHRAINRKCWGHI